MCHHKAVHTILKAARNEEKCMKLCDIFSSASTGSLISTDINFHPRSRTFLSFLICLSFDQAADSRLAVRPTVSVLLIDGEHSAQLIYVSISSMWCWPFFRAFSKTFYDFGFALLFWALASFFFWGKPIKTFWQLSEALLCFGYELVIYETHPEKRLSVDTNTTKTISPLIYRFFEQLNAYLTLLNCA